MLPSKEHLLQEEDELRQMIQILPEEDRRKFYSIQLQELRDPDTFAVLVWLFAAGAHHIYLKRWAAAIFDLGLLASGILLLLNGSDMGIYLLLGLGLFNLPYLFFSQRILINYNNQMTRQLLEQFSDHSLAKLEQKLDEADRNLLDR